MFGLGLPLFCCGSPKGNGPGDSVTDGGQPNADDGNAMDTGSPRDSSIASDSDAAGGGDTAGGSPDVGTSGGHTLNPISAAVNFPSSWYFNQSIANASLDPNSSTMITQLGNNGGWGNGNTFQIDWGIGVIFVNMPSSSIPANSSDTTTSNTASLSLNGTAAITPDSDIPTTVPETSANVTAPGAGFESSTGSMSDGGDDHNLVFDNKTGYLYELYQANIQGGALTASGIVIWDPSINYPVNLRGDVCTSADASGALMAPLLATPDEVAAGTITHALRLILPNSRIQNKQYVRPATHGTGGSSWATMNGIPYGARFRLHSSFTLPGASPAAEAFITALKTYGMILSDGGDIALSIANDDTFEHKWANLLPNGSHELYGIDVTDFDIVAPTSGTYINFTSYTCVRTPASLIPGTTQ